MARAGRALGGIFGEFLDKLLRQTKSLSRRAIPSGRAAARRADGVTEATRLAREYADELRALPRKKRPRAATVAVDTRTGRPYRGHSGEDVPVPEEVGRRLPDPSNEPWSATNCGEVSAASRAVDDGAQVDDLAIVTVVTKDGEIFPPCGNCRTWVP